MSAKNKFLALIFTFLLALFLLVSCAYYKQNQPEQFGEQEKNNLSVNLMNESSIIIVSDINETTNTSKNEPAQPEEPAGQEQTEEKIENQTLPRVSEVEFYFLLKGKAYFRHTLKEQESKTYNMSGYLVTIQPVFISSDRAKFQINNYTTKALTEEEWDSTQEFEIMVKDIYYRS